MKRWTTTATRVALALVAGATLVHSGPARAQDDAAAASTLGGFEGTAAASGLRVVYNPQGILPIPPPIDLSAPDALATIAAGVSTFARAAVADPGDLLANPDPLFVNASPSYPAGSIPPWPLRISASNGSGAPAVRLTPAPGLEASVAADDAGSSADASTPRISAPAIATVGTARSHATTHTDGSTVTLVAESSLSDFDLLGLLTIDGVSTSLTVTSDGVKTTTSGGTVITGASALGQPVTVDADGIHPQKGARGVQSAAVTAVNEALKTLGLRVTVASPIQQESPQAGQLISAGLRVDLEVSEDTYPQIGDLLDQLPPLPTLIPGAPGLDDIVALARARHLVTIGIGQAEVSLGARALEPVTELPAYDLAELPSGPPGSLAFDPGSVPTVPTVERSQPIDSKRPEEAPSPGFAEGIGLVAVLGLLLQPVLADRISRGAAALLASDAHDACPRERT
jgi:hypothetical protein